MTQSSASGRYFEDFVVGDVYKHALGRTLTETDNAWFTMLTLNTNQLHFNDHYAANSAFGRTLMNSTLTLAVVTGISVADVSQNAMANLGWEDIKLVNPVFAGDTLYAETKVLAARESKSRPNVGIVTVATRGINQDGDVVITFRRTVMILKRDAPQDKGIFPETDEPWDV